MTQPGQDQPGQDQTTAGWRLQRWSAADAVDRIDDLVAVYRAAFLEVHEADPARAAAERRAFLRGHLDRFGLRTVAALTEPGDRLVGFGYATPGRGGQWWHDVVSDALGEQLSAKWLSDCLEVVELHVLPQWQGGGIGGALLDALLTGAPQRTAALSALDLPGSPALRLYASRGFTPLLSGFQFPGSSPTYTVLATRLDDRHA